MQIRNILLESWRKPNVLTWLLWPISKLYHLLFILNRFFYRVGLKKSYRAPIPVIVIGNLTVGGTGKTPVVIHVTNLALSLGLKPGVISRGYQGESVSYPLLVDVDTPVAHSGDEPALIVRRTGVPVCVGSDRKASIELLIQKCDVNLIISDDGLQHFALQRDIEVCLVDHTSPLANSFLLPAGPLREPTSRLKGVDFVIDHGSESEQSFGMTLDPGDIAPVLHSNSRSFDRNVPTFAVAGIGNPERFFETCRALGLTIATHSFPDHHQFSKADINFNGQVLMTEKDAVKCIDFADDRHWFLPVEANIVGGFDAALTDKIVANEILRSRT